MYKPVGLEEQAKQMLQAHNPSEALKLAIRAAATNENWTDGAIAEIGYVLLHGTLHSRANLKHPGSIHTV